MAPAAPRAALVALVSFAPAAALALGGVPAAPVLLAGQAVLTAGAVAVTTRRDSGASPGAAGGGTGRGGVGERAGDHPPARDPSPASASDEEVARLQAALDALARQRELDEDFARRLEAAEDEAEVLAITADVLRRADPDRPVEVHLVDRERPLLRLVLATPGGEPLAELTVSPWESLAARTGRTVVYADTGEPAASEVCPHLASRVVEPCSAVCVPLTSMGRILGVLYATGPRGAAPPAAVVARYESIARRLAAHIAVVRAFAAPTPAEARDPLTGVADRATILDRLRVLIENGRPFSVAVADVDHFRAYNELHGRAEGDVALRTLAATITRSLRPSDLVGRVGGEELLMIFPGTDPADAQRAAERVREHLVLTHTAGEAPGFTCSFGVIRPAPGTPIERVLVQLSESLLAAKQQGRNRVVCVDHAPSSGEEQHA